MPVYCQKHSGTVIILGNAYCLEEDYCAAREIHPEVPVIAVNGSASFTKAFALFTQHPANFPKWIKGQRKFGDDFSTHSAGTARDRTAFGKLREYKPWVDYWWKYGAAGGTSVWGARRVASYMGFDSVILCGMPLKIGGYHGKGIAKAFQRPEVLDHYRSQIVLDEYFHKGVKSMSGWTREFFGAPD